MTGPHKKPPPPPSHLPPPRDGWQHGITDCPTWLAHIEDRPDEHWPSSPERIHQARTHCNTCPVTLDCAAWALRTDVAGMCGSLTPHERDLYRDAQRTPRPTKAREPDGTFAAEPGIPATTHDEVIRLTGQGWRWYDISDVTGLTRTQITYIRQVHSASKPRLWRQRTPDTPTGHDIKPAREDEPA